MKKKLSFIIFVMGVTVAVSPFLFSAHVVSAHEAYVLTASEFKAGLESYTRYPFAPLFDAAHIKTFLLTALAVIFSYILVFIWSASRLSQALDGIIKKAKIAGPLIIRLAISASFLYAAMSNSVLGPELPLSMVPYGMVVRFLLFLTGLMVLFGVLVELAAFIALIVFIFVTFTFGVYMVTYANYFGEIIVLLLFGSRYLSFDGWIFGKKLLVEKLERFKWLETPIVRVLYGVALIYAGYTIKFVHQGLTVNVYNEYHLVNFFHAAASYIAAGAGVAEISIGLFIILGFAMRWTVLISLVFITLSILYFRELLWPHFMLYGISLSLLINSGDRLTLDSKIVPWLRGLLRK